VPVLIDPARTLITGHARVMAAIEIGLERVPAICVSHLNEQQVRAFMLADNKLAEGAEWDLEVLRVELADLALDVDFEFGSIGFNDIEVDALLHGDDESPPTSDSNTDEALPPLRNEPVTRTGDLYRLRRNLLICGDARDPKVFGRLVGSDRAQICITDAPYNCKISAISGLGRHQHRDFAMASGEMSPVEFTAFLKTIFTLLAQHSVDGALHYLFMDHHHIDELVSAAAGIYTERKNVLVWDKTSGGMGAQYRSQHELIFLYKHGKAPHINNIQLGANGRYRTNILRYAGCNTFRAGRDEELSMHPTVKPTGLIADLLRDSSRVNDLVLDSFVGSGTIFIAAEKTRRRAAGIEISPHYCDVAIERWQKYAGESAVLVEPGQTFAEVAAERLEGAARHEGATTRGEQS